jgi:hypothetical protein
MFSCSEIFFSGRKSTRSGYIAHIENQGEGIFLPEYERIWKYGRDILPRDCRIFLQYGRAEGSEASSG